MFNEFIVDMTFGEFLKFMEYVENLSDEDRLILSRSVNYALNYREVAGVE